MKIAMIIDLTDEQIYDLICTGFNGACGEWLTCNANDIRKEAERLGGELNVPKQIMKTGICNIYGKDKPYEKIGFISLPKIHNALQAMALGEDLNGKKFPILKKRFLDIMDNNYDSITANIVFQIAVMGEVKI